MAGFVHILTKIGLNDPAFFRVCLWILNLCVSEQFVTVTFDQMNVSLLNKSENFFKNKS